MLVNLLRCFGRRVMWWGRCDCLERALAIQELAYGREHLQLASVLVNLAEGASGVG